MGFTANYADEISENTVIQNAPFWPEFDLAKFQKEYRLPGNYHQEMIEGRVKLALIWVNDELNSFRVEKEGKGCQKLTEVEEDPALSLGSESRLEMLYVRAVCCKAKAYLLKDYKTVQRRSDAANDAKESEETADTWHAAAGENISKIKGKTFVLVEAM